MGHRELTLPLRTMMTFCFNFSVTKYLGNVVNTINMVTTHLSYLCVILHHSRCIHELR